MVWGPPVSRGENVRPGTGDGKRRTVTPSSPWATVQSFPLKSMETGLGESYPVWSACREETRAPSTRRSAATASNTSHSSSTKIAPPTARSSI